MARDYDIVEVREGAARLRVPPDHGRRGPGSRGPWPFYNASMTVNRDVSAVALLRFPVPVRRALDGFASTGVWGIRMRLEAGVHEVRFSDVSPRACGLIQENLELNGLVGSVLHAPFDEAVGTGPFEFVDIDPFGTPAPFLEAASHGAAAPCGLGITATDTATLAGTYPDTCLGRYGARSLRGPQGREVGLRILLAYAERIAAASGRRVRPLLAFSAEHFLRVLLMLEPARPPASATIGYVRRDAIGVPRAAAAVEPGAAGPLWLGPMCEPSFVRRLEPTDWTRPATARLLDALRTEADMPAFFVSIEDLARHERAS
ncbi:MAG: hypothetical protein ACT4OI_08790, partial [Methanobacteriota archaeon]